MYSSMALDLIKKWEGFSSKAYLCPANKWTIGYGSTWNPFKNRPVNETDIWSQSQAETVLSNSIDYIAADILAECGEPIHQESLAAFISFCYNLGDSGDDLQTKRFKEKDYENLISKWTQYNKITVNGQKKELLGLTNRRKEELSLFISGMKKQKQWHWVMFFANKFYSKHKAFYIYSTMTKLDIYGEQLNWEVVSEKTEKSIKEFQKWAQISVDGIIGEETLEAALNYLDNNFKKELVYRKATNKEIQAFNQTFENNHLYQKWKNSSLQMCVYDFGFELVVSVTGQPNKQNFLPPQYQAQFPGNMYPIPSGIYKIEEPIQGEFGAVGNKWTALTPTFQMTRGGFGIHKENEKTGSAGCPIVLNDVEYDRLIDLIKQNNIKYLKVLWE